MSIQERTLSLSASHKPGRLILSFLRKQVLERLDGLRYAQLRIRDDWGEIVLGDDIHTNYFQIEVDDPAFYLEVALGGSNGAAAAYRAGYWRCDDLTGLFALFLKNIDLLDSMESGLAKLGMWWFKRLHEKRDNTPDGSHRNIHDHYDLGNDFFALFLDETLMYSAGIFDKPTDSLRQASINKLDHICQKLNLGVKDHVLEIGTGWGGFAIHAAKYYGCKVTTTTISREQFELAKERVKEEGLSDQVELLLTDYRDLDGQYDKLVSIEMIEAVGQKFLSTYFDCCSRLLKRDGQMLLQAITMPDDRYDQYLKQTDFIQQFIFPGSCVPSLKTILENSTAITDLQVAHIENIGPHYATTLRYWLENVRQHKDEILALGYSQDFLWLWEYYLCYCEAGFKERYLGDLQIVFHKPDCRAEPLLPTFKGD